MGTPRLVGPPEVYKQSPKANDETETDTTGDTFMDLMLAKFNRQNLPGRLSTCFAGNQSPAFVTSGNPCLDFFFLVVPKTPPKSLTRRLQIAWAHDPLTTLKLILNLRAVRGVGKCDDEGFFTSALWLHAKHPKTLACNIDSVADLGRFKDLPEILLRLLQGANVRRVQRAEWLRRKGAKSKKLRGVGSAAVVSRKNLTWRSSSKRLRKVKSVVPREIRVKQAEERSKEEEERARALREQKRIAMAKKVTDRYRCDPDFRFLYEKISDHFAKCLKADIEFLNAKEYRKISLAAKWCPSLDLSFDRSTLLCESIAKKMFPRESFPEYEGVEEAHYVYRVRDRLRKQVLVPLRKALELPEVFIGAHRWNEVRYNRVASVAMKFYQDKFMFHDRERFNSYLEDVRAGKAKMAAGARLPHEIIESLYDGCSDGSQVAELQWKRMVDDLSKSGKLNNCLAVSDVSVSVWRAAMEASVALGLLVSELSDDPWRGKIITFSDNPQLHLIKGDDLRSKIEFVRRMECGASANFQKVFDLSLQVAVAAELKEEQMVKRVFVFSGMEFGKASKKNWETDYEAITRKFSEKGYWKVMPEIVFWNLIDSSSIPAAGQQKGVALASGFSKNLVKLFMNNDGDIDPEATMRAAISGEEYQTLVVMD